MHLEERGKSSLQIVLGNYKHLVVRQQWLELINHSNDQYLSIFFVFCNSFCVSFVLSLPLKCNLPLETDVACLDFNYI